MASLEHRSGRATISVAARHAAKLAFSGISKPRPPPFSRGLVENCSRSARQHTRSGCWPDVRNPKATWVEPSFIADVEFRNITSDGLLRQCSFKGLTKGTRRS